jgi:UDP-3-O-[3-hydroxymyristoyl] N-acetylglucosamine deacetylase
VERQTLQSSFSLDGVGLHNGRACRATVHPAPSGAGLFFVVDGVEIPARVGAVVETRLATTLAAGGATVRMVEHLLAALYALGVDDAAIAVEGGEVPVLDGSALPWVMGVHSVGLRGQGEARDSLVVVAPLTVSLPEGRRATVSPASSLSLSVAIDFAHPAIGRQSRSIDLGRPGAFATELSWARTFGFAAEVEALRASGLIAGGSLDNALVFGPDGSLNPEGLRAADEPVRHKLLDLVGDLALLGRPLHAHVEVERPGHTLTAALTAALLGLGVSD